MNRALELATKIPSALPNPRVGAVIEYRGQIVGEGYHRGPGRPHAEVEAIRDAKRRGFKNFKNARLFVTLEPCCHLNKRTPPCVPLIVKTGFKRVEISALDPNPKVSGRGVQQLRRAGVQVKVGILRSESEKLNQAFIKNQILKLPYITLKIATTFDGKMADDFGKSKWITGELARAEVHRLRFAVDAIGVGSKTVDRDQPRLNVRLNRASGLNAKTFSRKIVVFGKPRHSASLKNLIRANGKENVSVISTRNLKTSLTSLYKKNEIRHLLIEGGPRLASSFLAKGLVDELVLYLGNGFLGGLGRYSLGTSWGLKSLGRSIRFQPDSVALIGSDVRIHGLFNVYRTHSKPR